MVIETRRTGFEQHVVLKDAAAVAAAKAAGAGTVSWTLPVKTQGLTARAETDGSVSFVDTTGAVVSRFAVPVAWDAAIDPNTGDRVNTAPVKLTVAQKGKGRAILTITPDQAWVTDPARQFPITVDPTYASGSMTTSFDTFAMTNYVSPQDTSTELRMGYNDVDTARSFLMFPTSALAGKEIVSASLNLYATHSWSCTAKGWGVYSLSAAPTSATVWSNQPGMPVKYSSSTATKGFSTSCADGWVSVNVQSLVQKFADNGNSSAGLGLKADSETDPGGWKKFASSETSTDPYITYTYDRAPNQASTPTVSNAATYTPSGGSATTYTRDGKPTITAKASDADGNKVKVTFEVHSGATATAANLVSSCTTGLVAAGTSVSCAPTTTLTNGSTYWVRALSTDELGVSSGTWSTAMKFIVNSADPTAPTFSCASPYATNGAWTTTAPAANVSCRISAAGSGANAPVGISYLIDPADPANPATGSAKAIPQSSDPAVAKVDVSVPNTNGAHRIVAIATSPGGRKSVNATYTFGYGAASLTGPANGASTSGTVKVSGYGPPATSGTVTAQLQWRPAGTTTWTAATGTTMTVTTGAGGILTATGAWDTTTATGTGIPTRTPVTFETQVCFTYVGPVTKCTAGATPWTLTRLPHAFGNGYPTAEAGDGQVAQYTGELQLSETDVTVPGFSGDLTLSRSHLSFAGDGTTSGWTTDVPRGVFGPGWTANLDGADAGVAGTTIIDGTPVDGTINLIDEDGFALVYRHPSRTKGTYAAGTYLPATTDTVDAAAKLVLTGTGTGARFTFTEDDGTQTIFAPLAAPSGTTGATWVPTDVIEPGTTDQPHTWYGHDAAGRITRIVSAPTGLTATNCPLTGTLARGCRALDITYATTTTATATAPGDIAGQVKSATTWLWDPATSSMVSTAVASFTYDSTKRLVTATDVRANLTTSYGWDGTSTRIAAITPPGLAPTMYSYDTASAPRVKQVTRGPAFAGGANTALSSFVYGINPASPPTGAPTLSAAVVGLWGQNTVPTSGFAVFGADHPVTSTNPVSLTAADWPYADLSYVDADAYTVNTANYGAGRWLFTATDYDKDGRVTRTLDSGAVASIQDANTAGTPWDAGAVDAASTQTFYDAAGYVTDVYAPARWSTVAWYDPQAIRPHTRTLYDQGAPNGNVNPATGLAYHLPTRVTVAAAAVPMDPELPDLGAAVSWVDTSYDPVVAGDGNGWTLGQATKTSTIDPWRYAPAPDITTITRYDTTGRLIETRQPKSNGTDSGTTRTAYYSTGADTTNPACGNKPEWSGMVCRVYPAAAPSSGPTMPDTVTTYSKWLQVATETETSGTATRTTTTSYHPATDRPYKSVTTSTPGSTSRPGSYTHYNAATGLVDYTGVLNDPNADAYAADAETTGRTTTSYDLWGRPTSVTGPQGDSTATSYDTAARVASTTTTPAAGSGLAAQTRTYTYDGTDAAGLTERRGQVTKVTLTRPGGSGNLTWGAAYGTRGDLTVETMPGALARRPDYDEAGQLTGLTYTGQVTPVTETTDPDTGATIYTPGTPIQDQPWFAWTLDRDPVGRISTEYTGAGAGFDGTPGVTDPTDATAPTIASAYAVDRGYGYDYAGRLVQVTNAESSQLGLTLDPGTPDTPAAPCTKRTYSFDLNSNRTGSTSGTSGDSNCFWAGATTTNSYTYDTADRPTNSSGTGTYATDLFGRHTTVPAADTTVPAGGDLTLAYYDDDQARTITVGAGPAATTTTITLDANTHRQQLATTGPDGATTTTHHYTDSDDNPDWSTTTTTPTSGSPTTTTQWNAEDLLGDLGATIGADGTTSLDLATPHGDIATTVSIPAGTTETTPAVACAGWNNYTEYGLPATHNTGAVTPNGYGWLGGKGRMSPTALAGLTLMGDRLYNPARGLFTSLDPVPGGNLNAYTYPVDPINQYDLDGNMRADSGGGWWRRTLRYSPTRWGPFAKGNRHLVMRDGRPGLHFKNHSIRVEWDNRNGWHVNARGKHYRLKNLLKGKKFKYKPRPRYQPRHAKPRVPWWQRGAAIAGGLACNIWCSFVPPITIRPRRTIIA